MVFRETDIASLLAQPDSGDRFGDLLVLRTAFCTLNYWEKNWNGLFFFFCSTYRFTFWPIQSNWSLYTNEKREMNEKHVKCIKIVFKWIIIWMKQKRPKMWIYNYSCCKSSTKMILLIKCNEEMLSRSRKFIKLAAPSFSFVCWSGCFYLRFCVASLFTLGFYCSTSSFRAHADFMGISQFMAKQLM